MDARLGSFRFLLNAALLCTPLLCQAAARAEPCQPDAPVIECTPPAGTVDEAAPPEPASVANNAIAAAVADGISTRLALAAGGIESNALVTGFPMGLIALTGAKILLVKYAETLPEADKRVVVKAASATWGGAAFNNLLVMLAAPTPVAIVAGIVVGIMTWRHAASQYEHQDRLAALQKEKQERLGFALQELPAGAEPAPPLEQITVAAVQTAD